MKNRSTKARAAIKWLTWAVVALVLYVVTWPPIEIKLSQWLTPAPKLLPDGRTIIHFGGPGWLMSFYKPLHMLRRDPPNSISGPSKLMAERMRRHYEGNPAGMYWNWWMWQLTPM